MSRVRTRPTRDDTREKLFEAAARVFEEQGIGGASIEAIAAAAGFTRGAFYSNFKSKDELIIAMLEDHVEQSIRRNLDLLARHKNLADFIDALKTMDRSRQDPLGRSPLLHMEMILFVARAEKRRPELAKRLRARRKLITDIVETTLKNSGRNGSLNPTWTGAILLALEDGFRLHRLIDPETTPADSFLRAIGDLQRAIGIRRPDERCDSGRFSAALAPACALCNWPGDRAHLARATPCQIAKRGQRADGDADRKGDGVIAGEVVQQAGDPGTRGAAGERRQHDGAEDAAVMLALKDLQHHRAHDRGQAVAERALRQAS